MFVDNKVESNSNLKCSEQGLLFAHFCWWWYFCLLPRNRNSAVYLWEFSYWQLWLMHWLKQKLLSEKKTTKTVKEVQTYYSAAYSSHLRRFQLSFFAVFDMRMSWNSSACKDRSTCVPENFRFPLQDRIKLETLFACLPVMTYWRNCLSCIRDYQVTRSSPHRLLLTVPLFPGM